MRIRLTPQARQELLDIRTYIAADDPRAADRVVSRIRQTLLMLAQFPMIGRAGRVQGTREFSVTGLSFVVVYRLPGDDQLDVLAIAHTRRWRDGGGDGYGAAIIRDTPQARPAGGAMA